jgi:hypothetical protein
MTDNTALTPEMQQFNERLKRVEQAVALGEPDKIPMVPYISS